MSPGLALLVARRVASPLAIVLVVAACWMGADPRTSWIFGAALAALIATVRAAALPDAWLRGEGDWLGTAAQGKGRTVLSGWAGALAGAWILTAALGAASYARHGGSDVAASPMELSAVGGPRRSIVLRPGESFSLPLGEIAAGAEPGAELGEVRVAATATLGEESPATAASVELLGAPGPFSNRVPVARRTWLTSSLKPGTEGVRVTNVGQGALAILGPSPVQIWRPSTAWLGGSLRAFTHAALWMSALTSLALLAGVIMGPGVSATLAVALWIGGWMAGPLGGRLWLPGGPDAARALSALGEGRVPRPPGGLVWAATAVTLMASVGLGTLCLRSWRDEVRG